MHIKNILVSLKAIHSGHLLLNLLYFILNTPQMHHWTTLLVRCLWRSQKNNRFYSLITKHQNPTKTTFQNDEVPT